MIFMSLLHFQSVNICDYILRHNKYVCEMAQKQLKAEGNYQGFS